MPKLNQIQTQTVEQTVTIQPELATQLRKEFKLYHAQKKQLDAIKAKMDVVKGKVEDLLAEIGEEAIQQDGYRAKIVAGVRKKFDPKRFVRKGGDLKIYNESMVETPVAAYIKISVPGDKAEDE